jgi:sugar transferase (PEP-CTERM/EpsH1 system associated)
MNADEPPLIVHVIHHLVVGGMENTLVNLINHIPRERFRHAVVCIEDHSDFRLRIVREDVEVVALHRSRIGQQAVRKEIYRLCRRWRPGIVHSRNTSGLDALLPAWLARVPVRVHSEHGWDVDNLDGSKWKPALLRRLHRPLVDRYVTVSMDLAQFLERRVGVKPSRITQIYNGVDTQRFRPRGDAELTGMPAGFDAPTVVRIGTVGRIQAVKDQATLVRAVATLVGRRPDLRAHTRLLVIGDGPLLATLRRLVESLGLSDLAWLPGASDRVPDLMRMLDLFVLPSLNEGVSNTILEAMASGVPVLASRVGGNPELLANGAAGSLFEAGDVSGLAAMLERYLDDPDLRCTQSRAAREWAEARFSMGAMVERYCDVYDRLCQQSARQP